MAAVEVEAAAGKCGDLAAAPAAVVGWELYVAGEGCMVRAGPSWGTPNGNLRRYIAETHERMIVHVSILNILIG